MEQGSARSAVELGSLEPVRCPCGWARRAFADVPGAPLTLHQVDIVTDAKVHYHRHQTEVYYILDCAADGAVELDGERIAVRPGMAVYIPPGRRHRAVGAMKILNIVIPKFDPGDEWFD